MRDCVLYDKAQSESVFEGTPTSAQGLPVGVQVACLNNEDEKCMAAMRIVEDVSV